MPRRIEIANHHPRLTAPAAQVRQLFRTLDTMDWAFLPDGDLSVVFMDNAAIGDLHGRFLSDPTPTDVITFDGDPLLEQAGEICVSADYALDATQHHPLPFHEELSLYLAHGWLHLAGYDDLTDEARPLMRQAETRAMETLRLAGAFPAFRLKPKQGIKVEA